MSQRVFVKGRVLAGNDPELQAALASIYETPERPRCMCVEGGVDLYISRRPSGFHLARMPGTGNRHHPACPDYEPSPSISGRGALLGEAIVEKTPELVEVHLGFPLSKSTGRAIPKGEPSPVKDVHAPKHRMSLLALLHTLYENARFNRWYPAMAGARSQGVIRKYLMEAAEHIVVKGEPLSKRLYVPEPFQLDRKDEIVERRRNKLAFLNGSEDSERPFGVVVGQFKEAQDGYGARKIFIKHMPDTPLYLENKPWERVARVYAPYFTALEASEHKPRVMTAAVISARMENVYQIERLAMMLVSDEFIPVTGAFELPLVRKLIDERRVFLKPLQYDAPVATAFPNFILLDVRTPDGADYPLHIRSAFHSEREAAAKTKAIASTGEGAWLWDTAESVPALPPPRRFSPNQTRAADMLPGGSEPGAHTTRP